MDELFAAIQFIWSALQWLAQFFMQLFVYIWNFFVTIANFLWGVLKAVFSFAWNALSKAAGFIRHIWDRFFKGIFLRVMRAINAAHRWLEAHLSPIIKFLKKLRAWYDRFYKLYVRPILNMLQIVRRVLRVMRFLHISWAKTLDKWIAKVEADISRTFLQIRGILNSTIDFLNALADPLRLLRHPTLVLSFRRIFNGLVRVLTGRPPGYFFPSPRKGAPPGIGPVKFPFNANDPSQNPLASSYLQGNDGLGEFEGFMPGTVPDTSAVDDLALLEYFDDSLWPEPACTDVASCLAENRRQILARLPGGG